METTLLDPREGQTHYVRLWAPLRGLFRAQAICGFFALPAQEAWHPSCPTCQALIAADRAAQGEGHAA